MHSGLESCCAAGLLAAWPLALPAAAARRPQTATRPRPTSRPSRTGSSASSQQVQRDAVEKNRLNRDLNAAEKSVAQARGELSRLQRAAGRAQCRARAAARRSEPSASRSASATEENLAAQLRAAYFMGRNEPLKLLLNQRRSGAIWAKFDLLRLFRAAARQPD